ncbi:MAG: hypothetical protein KJ621_17930, partial [Proteobacteria bacterium]|nr:hypothetical protein [Pseudomonadota bacterium]MBU1741944.1 hypothetical protein [Pseudomonadota bacterium]
MSITAGVDIGSTASKAVVLRGGRVVGQVVGPSTTNPKVTARRIFLQALDRAGLDSADVDFVVGTGYGRTQVRFAHQNISEITCHGRGAHFLFPEARTVIDIGGQDTKAIGLDSDGNLIDFAMNDKCAAGTGRFLEAMARALEVPLADMGRDFFEQGEPATITSMCSVFAESEVINLINDGVARPPIVKGLLWSLAGRVAALTRRIGLTPELVLSGGVAKSAAVRRAVADKLGVEFAPLDGADPQLIGALGAALIAADLAG